LEIDLKLKTEILELQSWMDGGSVTLVCLNQKKQEFKIHFVQNVIWEILENSKLSGRIYFNDKLVEQRSEHEELIIKILDDSTFKNLNKLRMEILKEKIQYVKSEQYLIDVKKIKFYKRKE